MLPYQQPTQPLAARVDDLLARMTLDEKIDQLHQCGIGDANPNNLSTRADELRPTYGSFIANGINADLATRNALQKLCVEKSRLGIPAIFGCDVIHGYRAITPIPLAQACSWDTDLIRRACRMAAEIAHANGVDWTFAPMVDHCVDPRWGRIAETFGESPHAASAFAVASVHGYQNTNSGKDSSTGIPPVGLSGSSHMGVPPMSTSSASPSIAACLKHYVGYGASEGGRDYASTEISPQSLWENHLPPFEAGVRAGAKTVMSAFNDLNGIPTSANRYTLTEILRERWGFRGFVVSDWNAVLQLIQQGHADDETEAARAAFHSGVDMNMTDGLYRKHLPALIEKGIVTRTALDESVSRILRVKFELGLFEHPYIEPTAITGAAPTPAQLDLCEDLAARSLVLLKNENHVLPLFGNSAETENRKLKTVNSTQRIALIGPLATESGALLGSWSQQGRADEVVTIEQGLRSRLPANITLETAQGCPIEGGTRDSIDAALTLARNADTIILCLGENWHMSGENASRSTIRLAGHQTELAHRVAELGKPIVLVLISGRPIELHDIEPRTSAILAAWQPGNRAGAAIADILLGNKNPSGRLSVTWPRTTGQIPIYHNMRPRARTGTEGAYQDIPTTPHYEFGHGLSYTQFTHSPIRLTATAVSRTGALTASITVTNTGPRAGRETLLWFIRDPFAKITRPLKQLKHFETANLAPGASHTYQWEIVAARDLAYPDSDGRLHLDTGEIILIAGQQTATIQVID